MSTFKDILYKKNADETWTEWNNRLPTDEAKIAYIGETIYAKINDEEKAGKITGMLLNLDVEELIVLLESNDLLEDKIKEEYQVLRELEEYKMSEEEEDEKDEDEEEEEVEDRRQTHTVKEPWKSMMTEDEEEEDADDMEQAAYIRKECDEDGREYDDACWYEPPIKTITVKQMMLALDKLPRNAQLVITEEGFYSHTEFAAMMLPEPYAIQNKIPRLPDGTQVYRIGHSRQNYDLHNY